MHDSVFIGLASNTTITSNNTAHNQRAEGSLEMKHILHGMVVLLWVGLINGYVFNIIFVTTRCAVHHN